LHLHTLTDSRVSANGNRIEGVQNFKQITLAKNLVVCFTSDHLRATYRALKRKEQDPTTSGPDSIATVRDIRRLAMFLVKEHLEYGGCAQLIASIWQEGYNAPESYMLFPPKYTPQAMKGMIGIGVPEVLLRFQAGLSNAMRKLDLYPEHPTFNRELMEQARRLPGYRKEYDRKVFVDAYDALHLAFTDALMEGTGDTADIPVTATVLDRTGIRQPRHVVLLTGSNEQINLTDHVKPQHPGTEVKVGPCKHPAPYWMKIAE
jgi:hypothetical protein